MSKLSSRHQVTIPVGILHEAGLAAGDEVVIRATGQGRIEIERADDLVRPLGREPPGRHLPGWLPRSAARRMARVALDADVVIAFLDPSDAQHQQASSS